MNPEFSISQFGNNDIGVNLSKILGGSLPFTAHRLSLPSPSSLIRS